MKIVFFDGICSLCNDLVDLLIRLDHRQEIKFASLQGESAKLYLPHISASQDMDSIVYLQNGEIFQKSTAVLMILSDIGGVWKFLAILRIIPVSWRDGIYTLIAKNRYQLYGKRDTCRMPTPEERERILP